MYEETVNLVARFLGTCGAAIILYGGLLAVVQILEKEILKRNIRYNSFRRSFSLKIMIGLEFLVADDLIKTVLESSLNQIAVVAVIVAIRIVIGFSLNKELKETGPEGEAKGEMLD